MKQEEVIPENPRWFEAIPTGLGDSSRLMHLEFFPNAEPTPKPAHDDYITIARSEIESLTTEEQLEWYKIRQEDFSNRSYLMNSAKLRECWRLGSVLKKHKVETDKPVEDKFKVQRLEEMIKTRKRRFDRFDKTRLQMNREVKRMKKEVDHLTITGTLMPFDYT